MNKRLLIIGGLVLLVGIVVRSTLLSARIARSERELAAGGGGAHAVSDPDLQKAMNAYSAEHFADARHIAEGLLADSDRDSTHNEAVDLIVECWLSEGDYPQARAAAHKYEAQAPDRAQEALRRIDREERDYRRELSELEVRRARARTPERAAEVQLLTARVHFQHGQRKLAEAAYAEVVTTYPGTAVAARAQRQLDALHDQSAKD
jgi:hypothetical protein